MKIIYDFTLTKEEEVEEKVVSQDSEGKEITTIKTVKKPVDKTFVLKKPGRKLYDEAELFYGVKLSEGIKAGLLTRALLAKRFNNDGGVLSEGEKDKFSELYMGLFEKQSRFQMLEDKKNRSSEEHEEREGILEELGRNRQELQEFEMAQASLFDQTAENRARNKTILWWVTQMSYEKIGDKYKEIFGDGEYENRIGVYDAMEELEDDHIEELLTQLSYYVSFWYITKPTTREELETLLSTADKEKDIEPWEAPEEEVSDEKVDEKNSDDQSEKKKTRKKRRRKSAPLPEDNVAENPNTEKDVGEASPQTQNA